MKTTPPHFMKMGKNHLMCTLLDPPTIKHTRVREGLDKVQKGCDFSYEITVFGDFN